MYPPSNSQKGDGDCGNLLICGFFARGTNTIIDVRIMDTDAKSYHSKDQGCTKKCWYLDACLAQNRHFTPFVVSTLDGLVGRKAKELLK
jgi:hypothetical protein